MQAYEFKIPLAPIAAARPRVSKWGTYYPKKHTQYAEQLKEIITTMFSNNAPLSGPLEIIIEFGMQIPKSMSKKKTQLLDKTWHTKKPDIDNLAKMVLDCVDGVVFTQDSNVVVLNITKLYAIIPYTKIKIKELDDN